MTDKNRDFSQIRVGTVVAFPQTTVAVTAAKGYLVIARGQERFTFSSDTGAVINLNQVWWKDTGGYIVSQPEEQSVAEQASVRTREAMIEDLINCMKRDNSGFAKQTLEYVATSFSDEAEKRGDAAGYARRVAEEGGEAVHQWQRVDGAWEDCNADDLKSVTVQDTAKRTLYTAPQSDTRDETIAELMALKSELTGDLVAERAKVATLREALRLADQFITNGIEFGFICMPDEGTNDPALKTPGIIRSALAATGDE